MPLKGWSPSLESRAKMSAAAKGRPAWNKGRGIGPLDPVTGLKKCSKCKESLSADNFRPGLRYADGLWPSCIECERKDQAIWRDNNRELLMWREARNRARKKGIPFTITRADIHVPNDCRICQRPLKRNTGGWSHTPASPSLDVYDPPKGYIQGNIWVICQDCNRRKQEMSGEDHVTFGQKLIEAFGEYQMHQILIRAIPHEEIPNRCRLEVRCACGTFLLDRDGIEGEIEVSLTEIANVATAHYAHMAHPEESNGHKLIKGRK